MSRYLGVDYGTKRIGLAVGDDAERLATPLKVIDVRGGEAEQIRVVLSEADRYGVDALVVGLPLNMDGTDGPQAKLTRRFAGALEREAGRPVHLFDERLSSRAADELLDGADLTRKRRKRRRDAVAAQIMLQGFLDAGSQTRSGGSSP